MLHSERGDFFFFKFLTRHKIGITILVYILHLGSIRCQSKWTNAPLINQNQNHIVSMELS